MGVGGRLLTTSCLLLSLAAAAAGADDAYAIQVRRPARVGDQFDVHLIFEETRSQRVAPVGATLPATLPAALAVSMTSTAPATSIPRAATAPATTAAASAPITHAIKADLTCRVEVTDVNYRGDISLSITVGRFTALPEGKELAPPGKVIGVQSDGLDVSLALHGGTLSDEARTVLRHVHPLEYQLDELSFGSRVPRRAGESWAVNADSVAQMDSNVQFKVDPASVKGQVTLVGAEKAGTAPALRLTVDLAESGQDRFRKPTGEMFGRQDSTTRIKLLLPTDASLPALETEIVTDRHASGTRRLEDLGKVTESNLEEDVHTSEKQTIMALPKPGK